MPTLFVVLYGALVGCRILQDRREHKRWMEQEQSWPIWADRATARRYSELKKRK